MKTKTYILTLSEYFPKGHPREGEETNFECAARRGLHDIRTQGSCKIHTIRANYPLWKARIDEVNAGRAILSVRQWLGAPRRSKQRELFRLDGDSGIGVEELTLSQSGLLGPGQWFKVSDGCDTVTMVVNTELSANDGLTLEDWRAWFSSSRYDRTQPMAIIHFTPFRYCK